MTVFYIFETETSTLGSDYYIAIYALVAEGQVVIFITLLLMIMV